MRKAMGILMFALMFHGITFAQKPVKIICTEVPPKYKTTSPQFPGGADAFDDYIRQAFKIPASLENQKFVKYAAVAFNVEADGSLSNVHVDRNAEADFTKEAIQVIKASPKWIPAAQDGKPVKKFWIAVVRIDTYKPR